MGYSATVDARIVIEHEQGPNAKDRASGSFPTSRQILALPSLSLSKRDTTLHPVRWLKREVSFVCLSCSSVEIAARVVAILASYRSRG